MAKRQKKYGALQGQCRKIPLLLQSVDIFPATLTQPAGKSIELIFLWAGLLRIAPSGRMAADY
ncbi:MAG: hypothetical protein LBP75_03240 [Planctomycetota bacterium]|nr:hypothetical protein [Planctomycetota bacterium]